MSDIHQTNSDLVGYKELYRGVISLEAYITSRDVGMGRDEMI